MAQVELQGLSKIYGGSVRAVDAIDLQIADKEFVVLVGPSGCGKTTTLRMIAGLEEITSGTIRIGDRLVNDVPPKDRDIAMVFQNYALYPHMTVYKNMAFGLKLRRTPKEQIRARVLAAAKTLEIEHLLERKPKELSGGQKQRVAVGRAIVREPAAFLFDEPLSNLDAKLRVTTRAELKRLHQRLQTTTVYVTHDQEEAMTLGDRIVAMKDGKVQQADAPLAVYNRPVNRFVAGFIGMPPMNFLDGAVRDIDGALTFVEGKPSGSDNLPYELTLSGNAFRLTVPVRLRESLAGWVGRNVVLGIRPEHLSLQPIAQGNAVLVLKIGVVEPLGSDIDVYAETPLGHRVVARVEADAVESVKAEAKVTMFADLRKIHFFEPGATGKNLGLSMTTFHEPAHAIA